MREDAGILRSIRARPPSLSDQKELLLHGEPAADVLSLALHSGGFVQCEGRPTVLRALLAPSSPVW